VNEIIFVATETLISWFSPLGQLDWGYIGILFGSMTIASLFGFTKRPLGLAIGSVAGIYGTIELVNPPISVYPDGTTPIYVHMMIWSLGIIAGTLVRGLFYRRPQRIVRFVQ
jgi:uncharacterized membrane protein YuzA (DUF378 family)